MAGSLAAEKAKLKKRLAEIEAEEKAEREKQEKIAGRVVMKVADADSAFAAQLRQMLDQHITGKRERAMFDLSAGKPAPAEAAGTGSTD